jgi:hypothetical protein
MRGCRVLCRGRRRPDQRCRAPIAPHRREASHVGSRAGRRAGAFTIQPSPHQTIPMATSGSRHLSHRPVFGASPPSSLAQCHGTNRERPRLLQRMSSGGRGPLPHPGGRIVRRRCCGRGAQGSPARDGRCGGSDLCRWVAVWPLIRRVAGRSGRGRDSLGMVTRVCRWRPVCRAGS